MFDAVDDGATDQVTDGMVGGGQQDTCKGKRKARIATNARQS